MAEVVDNMPPSRGIHSVYHWDSWLDGRIWKLTRGVDFAVAEANFRSAAYVSAKRRGMKVSVNMHDGSVFIQAYKPSTNGDGK